MTVNLTFVGDLWCILALNNLSGQLFDYYTVVLNFDRKSGFYFSLYFVFCSGMSGTADLALNVVTTNKGAGARVRVCVCVCTCVRACVRACVCVCVCVCVY